MHTPLIVNYGSRRHRRNTSLFVKVRKLQLYVVFTIHNMFVVYMLYTLQHGGRFILCGWLCLFFNTRNVLLIAYTMYGIFLDGSALTYLQHVHPDTTTTNLYFVVINHSRVTPFLYVGLIVHIIKQQQRYSYIKTVNNNSPGVVVI